MLEQRYKRGRGTKRERDGYVYVKERERQMVSDALAFGFIIR